MALPLRAPGVFCIADNAGAATSTLDGVRVPYHDRHHRDFPPGEPPPPCVLSREVMMTVAIAVRTMGTPRTQLKMIPSVGMAPSTYWQCDAGLLGCQRPGRL